MSLALSFRGVGITDSAVSRSIRILDCVFPPPRDFAVALWNGQRLPSDTAPAFTLTLRHPSALRRMLTPPVERSAGEAFVFQDIEIEGSLEAAVTVLRRALRRSFTAGEIMRLVRDLRGLPTAWVTHPVGRIRARLRGRLHSRGRDRRAIQYHYDVGNEFYGLWLDRRWQYSCAYFPTGRESLDEAQERKLDHICRKLRLGRGDRLLDIGCGWGGLVRYAAERYDCRAVGITLSPSQLEFARAELARAGLADRVEIRLQDYREVGGESFDKIVSVGMLEHVGWRRMSGYFARAYELLRPGGLFLNHGIARRPDSGAGDESGGDRRRKRRSAWRRLVDRKLRGFGTFSPSYVFPDGELVPVSQLNLLAEAAGFEVRDVENLREHYARTLRLWVERLEAQRDAAIRATSDAVYRIWRLYMTGAALQFDAGRLSVNQTLLAKPDRGRVRIPPTRSDLYHLD